MKQIVEGGRILYRFTKRAVCWTVFLSTIPILLPAISIAWCIGFALVFQLICGALGLALLRGLLSTYFACRSTVRRSLSSRARALILPIDPDLGLIAASSLDDAILLLKEASCRLISESQGSVSNIQSPSTSSRERESEHESLPTNQSGFVSSERELERSAPERNDRGWSRQLSYGDQASARIYLQEVGEGISGDDLRVDLVDSNPSSGDIDGNCGQLVVSGVADLAGVTPGESCRHGKRQGDNDSASLSVCSSRGIRSPIRETDALECMKVVEFCLSQAEEFGFDCSTSEEEAEVGREYESSLMQEVISLRVASTSEDCSSSSKSARPGGLLGNESPCRLTSSMVESLSEKISTRLKTLEMESEGDGASSVSGKLSMSFSDEIFSGSSARESDESSSTPRVSFSSRLEPADSDEVSPSFNSNSLRVSSMELSRGSGLPEEESSSTGMSRTRMISGGSSPDVELASPSLKEEGSRRDGCIRSWRRGGTFQGFSPEEMKVLRKLEYSEEMLSRRGGGTSSSSSNDEEMAALNKFQRLLRFWREKERNVQNIMC